MVHCAQAFEQLARMSSRDSTVGAATCCLLSVYSEAGGALLAQDESLAHEPLEGLGDRGHRAASRQSRDPPAGERLRRTGEHDQHVALDRRGYGTVGARHVRSVQYKRTFILLARQMYPSLDTVHLARYGSTRTLTVLLAVGA